MGSLPAAEKFDQVFTNYQDLIDAVHTNKLLESLSQITGDAIENYDQRLDPESFANSYDPSLPTLVFDIDSFPNSELLAAANRGEKVANIVHVSSAYQFGTFACKPDGTANLLVTRGIITTPDGQFKWGTFPHPVIADSLQTIDPHLQAQSERYGVKTVMSKHTVNDKMTESLPAPLQSLLPKRYRPEEMWRDDPQASYVIKPSNRYMGIGIGMFNSREDATRAQEYFSYLADAGYEPIIEEKLEGIPLLDPETGQELDWNIRALVNKSSVAGMYIRASGHGGAVNRSQGAQVLRITDLPKYINDPAQASRILQVVDETAQKVATDLPEGFWGADIFVDSKGRGRLFEVNAGNVGGLATITGLEAASSKFAMARSLLESWVNTIKATPRTAVTEYVSSEKIHNGTVASFVAALALRIIRQTSAINHVTMEDIGGDNAQPEAIDRWLLAQHVAAEEQNDVSRILQVEAWQRDRYPLDDLQSLPKWIAYSPKPELYGPYLDRLGKFLPNDPTISKAKEALEARLQSQPH